MTQVGHGDPVQRVQGNMDPEESEGPGCVGFVLHVCSLVLFLLFFPVSLIFTLKIIQEYERGVIFRLGRVVSGDNGKGPGIIFVLPCVDELRRFDLRTHSYDIRPQQVMTRDSVNITVDAVVFSRVKKLTRTVMYLSDPHHSTRLLAATTLRKFVGQKGLYELMSDRRQLSEYMQRVLDRNSERWGMQVERVSLKNIYMPQDMQRAMATEAETDRRAKARVIAAKGEMQASHALKEAADVISQSRAGVKLRMLETLNQVAKKNNNTVILPIPPTMLHMFLKRR